MPQITSVLRESLKKNQNDANKYFAYSSVIYKNPYKQRILDVIREELSKPVGPWNYDIKEMNIPWNGDSMRLQQYLGAFFKILDKSELSKSNGQNEFYPNELLEILDIIELRLPALLHFQNPKHNKEWFGDFSREVKHGLKHLPEKFKKSIENSLLLNFHNAGVSTFFDFIENIIHVDNDSVIEKHPVFNSDDLVKKMIDGITNEGRLRLDLEQNLPMKIVESAKGFNWSLKPYFTENEDWKRIYAEISLFAILSSPSSTEWKTPDDLWEKNKAFETMGWTIIPQWLKILKDATPEWKEYFFLSGNTGNTGKTALENILQLIPGILQYEGDYDLRKAKRDISSIRSLVKEYTGSEESIDKQIFKALSKKLEESSLLKTDLANYINGMHAEKIKQIQAVTTTEITESATTAKTENKPQAKWVIDLSDRIYNNRDTSDTVVPPKEVPHFKKFAINFFNSDDIPSSQSLLFGIISLWRKHGSIEEVPGEKVREKYIQFIVNANDRPLHEDAWSNLPDKGKVERLFRLSSKESKTFHDSLFGCPSKEELKTLALVFILSTPKMDYLPPSYELTNKLRAWLPEQTISKIQSLIEVKDPLEKLHQVWATELNKKMGMDWIRMIEGFGLDKTPKELYPILSGLAPANGTKVEREIKTLDILDIDMDMGM